MAHRAPAPGCRKRIDFRMRAAGPHVPALADDCLALRDHAANPRIRDGWCSGRGRRAAARGPCGRDPQHHPGRQCSSRIALRQQRQLVAPPVLRRRVRAGGGSLPGTTPRPGNSGRPRRNARRPPRRAARSSSITSSPMRREALHARPWSAGGESTRASAASTASLLDRALLQRADHAAAQLAVVEGLAACRPA